MNRVPNLRALYIRSELILLLVLGLLPVIVCRYWLPFSVTLPSPPSSPAVSGEPTMAEPNTVYASSTWTKGVLRGLLPLIDWLASLLTFQTAVYACFGYYVVCTVFNVRQPFGQDD